MSGYRSERIYPPCRDSTQPEDESSDDLGHHDAAPWNAVWRDGRLTGFVDWDTAGPWSPEFELAYLALTWVPLFAPEFIAPMGFTAPHDRSRRFHLLLDAYGYDGAREQFPALIARRARISVEVIHRLAASDEPVYVAMLGWAQDLERAAREVESMPAAFWTHPPTLQREALFQAALAQPAGG